MAAEEKSLPRQTSIEENSISSPTGTLTIGQKLDKFRQSYPDLIFILSLWFWSRLLILVIMFGVAPFLPEQPGVIPVFGDWSVFAAWDSDFYRQIAQQGYSFIPDSNQHHSVAFFPLYPLLAKALTFIGIKFRHGAVLVNNGAFLGTIVCLFYWMKSQYGGNAARWIVAVLALCPLSLYGTVIYTEGLYLFVSTLSLWSFESRQYLGTAWWGALATATRPTGVALIPALLLVSLKEKRGLGAIAASLATGAGIGAFSLYCWWKFQEPLAFFAAQRSWRPDLGFDRNGWLHMFMEIIVGWDNWKTFTLVNPLHPLIFALTFLTGLALWWKRRHLPAGILGYSSLVLGLILWLLGGDAFLNILMSLGGGYLLWIKRHQLSLVVLTYGFCGLGLILASGSTISVNRISYGIISLSIATGLWLSDRPFKNLWGGYIFLSWFGIVLATFALRFARNLWVA